MSIAETSVLYCECSGSTSLVQRVKRENFCCILNMAEKHLLHFEIPGKYTLYEKSSAKLLFILALAKTTSAELRVLLDFFIVLWVQQENLCFFFMNLAGNSLFEKSSGKLLFINTLTGNFCCVVIWLENLYCMYFDSSGKTSFALYL